MQGQNTSQMDSSKHGVSKSEIQEDGQMSQSTANEGNASLKENFYKVSNVFEILITEAPFLIDDKVWLEVAELPPKQRHLKLIMAISNSLKMQGMQDVEMLVETFFEYGEKKKKEKAEAEERRRQEREEQMSNNNVPVNHKDAKKDKKDKQDAKNQHQQQVQEPAHEEEEEEEEKDPNKPDLDLDDVTECLAYYFDKKQERENSTDPLVNPTKKKSNFQTDEQKEEND